MFKKAVRSSVKLKLAITGPSGSGKTYSALKIAQGLGGKIAVIDTENASASLYSDSKGIPEFDTCNVSSPYTVEKYREAIHGAIKAGYETLVIDSISHVWAGEGGLLEQKEILDNRGGRQNSYTNWATITKQHEQFKSEILNADINIIGTMRSKQEYAQIDDNGKKTIRKLGMAPIQRDGIEYEFTIVFDMAMNHTAEVSKDRTGLFDGKIFKPTEETGKEIKRWVESGRHSDAKLVSHDGDASQNDVGNDKRYSAARSNVSDESKNNENPNISAIKSFLGNTLGATKIMFLEELAALYPTKKPVDLSPQELDTIFTAIRRKL